MKLLLDTHLLIWTAAAPDKLSKKARKLIEDRDNEIAFSAVSIWEIAIKYALQRPDFNVDPHLVRRGCLDNAMTELAMTSAHAITTASLPPIHKDPFDRLLIAQAMAEGVTLLTADEAIARYRGPIRLV
ncbi:type II toxin-antitoxin system VapC family toxin [Novosphingobium sp.]|jgi:PIN domain nuclease of toxin-antitoxin system|uniref:type II toxin-antitoxin system VapC family toxin n=1 Tax=Novosphingobium sp. TaxID=1874826 RepID=UPI00262AA56F|nr:type II toxin-antitoxin system VapC family toxin [Novosphingobium sp.]